MSSNVLNNAPKKNEYTKKGKILAGQAKELALLYQTLCLHYLYYLVLSELYPNSAPCRPVLKSHQ